MTYKDIINRFRETVEYHKMVQDFGYGNLSDLKTQSQLGPEEQGVDYPYMFLLPGSHTRQGTSMNYQFNIIMMDMAREEEGDVYDNYISIQSDCQQYIDDVLSQLYYFYSDKPEVQLSGITYTPFKEKYQDELAGMTATITITVPQPIDNCIAPFERLVEVNTGNAVLGLRNYNSNSAGTRRIFDSWAIPEAPAKYKFTGYVDLILQRTLTDDDAPYDVPYMVWIQDADNPRWLVEQEFDGTLVGQTQRITFDYELTLQDVPPDNNDMAFTFGYTTGSGFYPDNTTTITEYPNAIEIVGGELTIYKFEE